MSFRELALLSLYSSPCFCTFFWVWYEYCSYFFLADTTKRNKRAKPANPKRERKKTLHEPHTISRKIFVKAFLAKSCVFNYTKLLKKQKKFKFIPIIKIVPVYDTRVTVLKHILDMAIKRTGKIEQYHAVFVFSTLLYCYCTTGIVQLYPLSRWGML